MAANYTQDELDEIKDGPIKWMAAHPVAANLLMIVCLIGGFFLLGKMTKEVFPEFTLDTVRVSMNYPGATPEEVEQSIILAIEEALADIDDIEDINATAREGGATVTAEITKPEERIRVSQDVTTAVNRITTFPVDAEDLTVSLNSRKRDVMELALYGDLSESALRDATDLFRDRLENNPAIGPVELVGAKEREIHIEISQENLRRYDLRLADVADRIQATALELGGGSVRTQSGEILLRIDERRDYAGDFATLPIITLDNGAQVRLGDIATISEGFDDSINMAKFNGRQAILMDVFRTGDQTPDGVAKAVYKEIDQMHNYLPKELKIGIADDDSVLFNQRAELLMRNGAFGLILVILFLALFLDVRLAFWVSMGIPISFMGAFLIFPVTDFTVNIVSMFAFLIALGIVVDDAIVCGENIYSKRQKGYRPLAAAVAGAREISIPMSVSILTNMVAFVPLFFIPGFMGKVFGVIPIVVISVFMLSLIESLFILPNHLTFPKRDHEKKGLFTPLINFQRRFNKGFENFVKEKYAPFLQRVIEFRYAALALFVAILIGFLGYIMSGRIGLTMFPVIESDYSFASVTLKVGTDESRMQVVEQTLIESAEKVIEENGKDQLATGIFTTIEDNMIEARVFLTQPKVRPISTYRFTELWREATPEIPGIETSSFQADRGGPGSGKTLSIELSHRSTEVLDKAAIDLAIALEDFPIVDDIDDGSAQGKRQFDFTLKDLGFTLGFTTADIARQVRDSFYGSEAFKQQRGRDEIRVLARLPEAERESAYDLQNLILRAPDGREVLLSDVVHVNQGRAYTTISRRDGRRVITVSADVTPRDQANRIIAALQRDALPRLLQQYPGLSYSFEGSQAEIRESMGALVAGLIAVLFVMYGILAVLFKSYIQPAMILIAIPFSMVGAVAGHWVMGYSLSIMSMFGILALAGVVVNDSLILIEFANRRRKELSTYKAVIEAGIKRFRPITLTTLTTFIGLAPMILETSRQARFLIPMAISLGFGILFATALTLILIPALYMIIEDLKSLKQRVIGLYTQ